MTDLEKRIQMCELENSFMCELENSFLRKKINRQNKFWSVAFLLALGGGAVASVGLKQETFESVTAKEIVVVDSAGIVRARLGGDLPDGVMANGHVAKRGSKAGGLIIYDEEGIERGGYVTQDQGSNAMLTLDSKYRQLALFVAGPGEKSEASALRLWNKGGSIELRSDASGPRLTIADSKKLKIQQPEVSPSPDICAEYKKAESPGLGRQYCEGRFTEAACNVCLGAN